MLQNKQTNLIFHTINIIPTSFLLLWLPSQCLVYYVIDKPRRSDFGYDSRSVGRKRDTLNLFLKEKKEEENLKGLDHKMQKTGKILSFLCGFQCLCITLDKGRNKLQKWKRKIKSKVISTMHEKHFKLIHFVTLIFPHFCSSWMSLALP